MAILGGVPTPFLALHPWPYSVCVSRSGNVRHRCGDG